MQDTGMTMDRRMQLLLRVVCDLRQAYEDYLRMAETLREALILGSRERIVASNMEIEEHLEELGRLDQLRADHMEAIAAMTGRDYSSFNELLQQVPGSWSAPLLDAVEQLREIVGKVRRVNQRNEHLILNARGIVRGTLSIIAGHMTDPKERKFSVYGDSGSYCKTKPAHLLDRRG